MEQHRNEQLKKKQINQGNPSSFPATHSVFFLTFISQTKVWSIFPWKPRSLHLLFSAAPPMKFLTLWQVLIQGLNVLGANLSTQGFEDYLTHSFHSVNSTLCSDIWIPPEKLSQLVLISARRSLSERRLKTETCLAPCWRPPLVEKIPPEPNPLGFPVDFLGFRRFILRDIVRWMEYQACPHHLTTPLLLSRPRITEPQHRHSHALVARPVMLGAALQNQRGSSEGCRIQTDVSLIPELFS